MSKIYTKTGDAGQTSLLGGGRVTKDCITLQVVGELDELNAALGLALSAMTTGAGDSLAVFLQKIQRDLFRVGAECAGAQTVIPAKAGIHGQIDKGEIEVLEKSIDEMSAALPALRNFILPGGSSAGAHLHLARAICRRAERALVSFGRDRKLRPELYQYLNRLSDWLFTTARFVNVRSGAEEIKAQ